MTGNLKGTSYDLNGEEFSHFIDEVSFNLTAGVKYKISHRIDAFVEMHRMLATTEELDGAALDRLNDKFGGARIGLFIKISRVNDQDKDGVPDKDDDCPDTPPGVKVDENGCPLDTDNDGIPDYEDDCPDDPGLPEYNGCPDSDGDGIIDKEDDCPELPGLPEYNGCPDSDGDGVIDPKDLCPDTQPGVVVDDYGCPIDSDGDGLTDDVDQCPDEYGPMEYLGCPEPPDVGWPSMNKDTPPEVYFKTAEYELDPDAEEELQKIVKYLFENPMMNIRLYGFADPRGTKEYNAVLSARRVEAVKKFLMRKGLPENRIMVKALGEIQEVKTKAGEENMSIDQKYRKARKVQFETFFFMH
jgi:outer membrane protein OmpA-like peptidoglycan-associated protein